MARKKTKSNGLRKRGQLERSQNGSSAQSNIKSTTVDDDGRGASQSNTTTTWQDRIAKIKPFIGITLLVMIPLALHNAYLFLCLQRPEWLAMVFSVFGASGAILRPSVSANDARQVLVVGTMSSGTTQVAHELSQTLGLEIGHENSETRWSFVRDGTISWFHGIRFLPRPGIDYHVRLDIEVPIQPSKNGHETEISTPKTKTVTIEGKGLFRYVVGVLCRELRPNMGFHPFMYRDNGRCSFRQSWNDCWKDECASLLRQEWGCALDQDPSTSQSSCVTPYHKTLHQVRNPLKTVESLVTKFCIGGIDGSVQDSFIVFSSALFPQHDFEALSCIEAAGYYVYEYNKAIQNAFKKGLVDSIYKVEDVTPCSIAKLAGFLEPSGEEEYKQQIRDHLLRLCNDDDTGGNASRGANQPMVSTKNKYNQGHLSLDWNDLLGGRHGSEKKQGDGDLQQRLKQMTKKLGY